MFLNPFLYSCLSLSVSVPINPQHGRWEGQTQPELCRGGKIAQITNPSWAPNSPWALLLGEQNTKSFRKKISQACFSSCYDVPELQVLAPFTHENKTTVSGPQGMIVAEKESESSYCYGWKHRPREMMCVHQGVNRQLDRVLSSVSLRSFFPPCFLGYWMGWGFERMEKCTIVPPKRSSW